MGPSLRSILDSMPSVAVNDLRGWVQERIERVKSIDNVEVSLNPIKTTIALNASKLTHKQLMDIFAELVEYRRKDEAKIDPRDSFTV